MSDHTPPDFDLYRELGLDADATVKSIEAAWRRLVKQHHPDHRPGADATRRTIRLNCAREWLTDPERRRRYDNARHVRLPAPSPRTTAPSSTLVPGAPAEYGHSGSGTLVISLLALVALALLGISLSLGVGRDFVPMTLLVLGATLALYYGLLLALGSR
jgi:curved DNA-binding protein CbpA